MKTRWIVLCVFLIAVAVLPLSLALSIRAAGVAGPAALAFGVSAFYTMPLRDYARWSIRGGGEGGGVGMDYATQWSLAPIELPTLVVPGWTAPLAHGTPHVTLVVVAGGDPSSQLSVTGCCARRRTTRGDADWR
jgi:hypothetical protein